jgi:hypothetical protein
VIVDHSPESSGTIVIEGRFRTGCVAGATDVKRTELRGDLEVSTRRRNSPVIALAPLHCVDSLVIPRSSDRTFGVARRALSSVQGASAFVVAGCDDARIHDHGSWQLTIRWLIS